MRFLADGPSIPDDLLLARDQGRVIFFCGAGVSRACAKLPDFFGLAREVVSKLGVDQHSSAYKLIQEAQEIDRRVGIPGVISADRVFGLLERDFSSRDIEEAVASALKPPAGCDLTAHRILLDLATTSEGNIQLVTTNFDRLFDDCGRNTQTWQPPRLPDPLRQNEVNGIVYLHDRSTQNYTGAEGDGFILSSSEFGRAYLSDGWATKFIREILGKYVVVFVGYTADDPPVQYLLEALRKSSGRLANTYAFQSGDHNDASARWRHKGVEAIPYDPDNSHAALWRSLEAWAERARDPDAWYAKITEMAKRGPSAIQPHERGQVAHVVSTYEGVKNLCVGEVVPSAEWLCVFDKYRRFAKPGNSGSFRRRDAYVDPFDLYGLDSDTTPTKSDPEDHYAKREVPSDAWDAFELNRRDRSMIHDENLAAIRGYWSNHSPRLVQRISQLGIWIAKVCDQPAAVWWAAHQSSLHQSIQQSISWELERSNRPIHKEVRNAWRSLFETWNYAKDLHREWHALQTLVKADGWSNAIIRRLGEILRPRLSAEPDFWGGPKPPASILDKDEGARLLRMEVKYPETHEAITVPDEWCVVVARVLRQNLELALTLEKEIGGYGLTIIGPIVQDNIEGSDHYQTHGLSAAVIQFSKVFSQLSEANIAAAKREFLCWHTDDDTIFARLRIWASGNRRIVSNSDFAKVIASLSDDAFWNSYHQRDLLLVLANRWNKLNGESRKLIEEKLMSGPKRWQGEKASAFTSRRLHWVLNRIQWLQDAGCRLSASIRERAKLFRADVPDWNESYGAKAAQSLESRGGVVRTNTNHEKLAETSLSLVLLQAKELSGRSDDFLIENDPFAGLAAQCPVRAFTALTYAAKRGDFPEWAWRSFLNSEARKNDKAKLSWLIAERICHYPNEKIAAILRPATDWLKDTSVKLSKDCLPIFDHILGKLTSILRDLPDEGRSAIVRGSKESDWTMEAINAPTGKIAQTLFNDPRKNDLEINQGFPSEWLAHAEALLALPDDLRRHAIVVFFHNLNWFFAIDPKWTDKYLLPVLEGSDIYDSDAAWSGFLWGAKTPSRELYMRLKSSMLEFSTIPIPSHRPYRSIIAGMIFAGWRTVENVTGERCISNDEMRRLLLAADDDFRSTVLWHAKQWHNKENEKLHKQQIGELAQLLKIWPRQLSVKSSKTSARLFELVLCSDEELPMIATLALPLLGKVEHTQFMLPELCLSQGNIVERHPKQILTLLHAVLPDNASNWPYGTEEILKKIGEVSGQLNSDDRLISLKRKWDAR